MVFDANANCRYTHGVGGDCNNKKARCAWVDHNVIVLLSIRVFIELKTYLEGKGPARGFENVFSKPHAREAH